MLRPDPFFFVVDIDCAEEKRRPLLQGLDLGDLALSLYDAEG